MVWGGDRLLDRINSPLSQGHHKSGLNPGSTHFTPFTCAPQTRFNPPKYLSEFEVLEKMADHGRMWTYAKIALLLKRLEREQYSKAAPGCAVLPAR